MPRERKSYESIPPMCGGHYLPNPCPKCDAEERFAKWFLGGVMAIVLVGGIALMVKITVDALKLKGVL